MKNSVYNAMERTCNNIIMQATENPELANDCIVHLGGIAAMAYELLADCYDVSDIIELEGETWRKLHAIMTAHLNTEVGESEASESDELEAREGEGISFDIEELADLHAWCDIWFEGGEWHAEVYGSDIETHHYVGESFQACESWVERKTAELLEDWESSHWGDEEYTIEDELADREFEAARERRHGYDD